MASTSRGVSVSNGRRFGTIPASDTRMAKGAGTLLARAVTSTALVDRSTINTARRNGWQGDRQDPLTGPEIDPTEAVRVDSHCARGRPRHGAE